MGEDQAGIGVEGLKSIETLGVASSAWDSNSASNLRSGISLGTLSWVGLVKDLKIFFKVCKGRLLYHLLLLFLERYELLLGLDELGNLLDNKLNWLGPLKRRASEKSLYGYVDLT
nr:hypothetical protein CFP56_37994 [Quercus suber]